MATDREEAEYMCVRQVVPSIWKKNKQRPSMPSEHDILVISLSLFSVLAFPLAIVSQRTFFVIHTIIQYM